EEVRLHHGRIVRDRRRLLDAREPARALLKLALDIGRRHRVEHNMFVLEGIERRYGATLALRIDRWEARAGERWLIAGPSGSGKSTALALLTGLLRPTSGTIVVAGQNLAALAGSALDRWRGRTIGFVPQRLHL